MKATSGNSCGSLSCVASPPHTLPHSPHLNELGQVAAVQLQPAVLVVVDVGAARVEEARVVGDDHARHVGLGGQVLLQPRHVGVVQVVGRLCAQVIGGTMG